MDREPWRVQSMGSQRVVHDWATEGNWLISGIWTIYYPPCSGYRFPSPFSSACMIYYHDLIVLSLPMTEKSQIPVNPAFKSSVPHLGNGYSWIKPTKLCIFMMPLWSLWFPPHGNPHSCLPTSSSLAFIHSYLKLPEKAMAPHSSIFAWKIPWTKEPGRLQSMGLLRVGHNWATSLSLFTFMHWRRKWQPTPVEWRIPGMGEPGGLLSMGSHRVGHDWSDLPGAASQTSFSSWNFLLSKMLNDLSSAFPWWNLTFMPAEAFLIHSCSPNSTYSDIFAKWMKEPILLRMG